MCYLLTEHRFLANGPQNAMVIVLDGPTFRSENLTTLAIHFVIAQAAEHVGTIDLRRNQ